MILTDLQCDMLLAALRPSPTRSSTAMRRLASDGALNSAGSTSTAVERGWGAECTGAENRKAPCRYLPATMGWFARWSDRA